MVYLKWNEVEVWVLKGDNDLPAVPRRFSSVPEWYKYLLMIIYLINYHAVSHRKYYFFPELFQYLSNISELFQYLLVWLNFPPWHKSLFTILTNGTLSGARDTIFSIACCTTLVGWLVNVADCPQKDRYMNDVIVQQKNKCLSRRNAVTDYNLIGRKGVWALLKGYIFYHDSVSRNVYNRIGFSAAGYCFFGDILLINLFD